MTARTVPSKIVIAGNSKMSLNDRFASLPKARPQPQFAKPKRHVFGEVEYTVPRFKRNQIRNARGVPIDQRVSFHQAPKIVYVPVSNGVPFKRNQKFIGAKNFVNNPKVNNFKRNNFKPNQQFKQPGGFKKQFPPRNPKFVAPKKKSVADLDKELDDYMRKPKHTPITV